MKAKEESLLREKDDLTRKLIKGKKTKEKMRSIEEEITKIRTQIERKREINFGLKQKEKRNHFTYFAEDQSKSKLENKNNVITEENIEK